MLRLKTKLLATAISFLVVILSAGLVRLTSYPSDTKADASDIKTGNKGSSESLRSPATSPSRDLVVQSKPIPTSSLYPEASNIQFSSPSYNVGEGAGSA